MNKYDKNLLKINISNNDIYLPSTRCLNTFKNTNTPNEDDWSNSQNKSTVQVEQGQLIELIYTFFIILICIYILYDIYVFVCKFNEMKL